MKIVTAMDLGHGVDFQVLDGVSVSLVKARNAFSQIGSSFKSTFGGHLGGLEKLYDDMREYALLELQNKAVALGADAIIALRVDINEIAYVNGIGVFAYGTAVKVK